MPLEVATPRGVPLGVGVCTASCGAPPLPPPLRVRHHPLASARPLSLPPPASSRPPSLAYGGRSAPGRPAQAAVPWGSWAETPVPRGRRRPASAAAAAAADTADTAAPGAGREVHERQSATKTKRGFLPFDEARAYVRAQGLQSQPQWDRWCKSGRRPADIPAGPYLTYRDEGWLSWADWLGYGPGRAPVAKGSFLPFEAARAVVRAEGLQSRKQWEEWCQAGKRPANVPSDPPSVYRHEGWLSMPDWLGTAPGQGPSGAFLPFEEARALAQQQGLQSKLEWSEWCQQGNRPAGVPSNPDYTYRSDGFLSWPDWLGVAPGRSHRSAFLPFKAARAIVWEKGLKSQAQWREWRRAEGENWNHDIPANPDSVYCDAGWLSWPDWLGYAPGQLARSRTSNRVLPFQAARAAVQAAGLENRKQWDEWCSAGKRPAGVPSDPHQVYRHEGWLSWPDFLGYAPGKVAYNAFLPFEEARTLVRRQGLTSTLEWKQWCAEGRRPSNVPSNPWKTYQGEGWLSMHDWLGYAPKRRQTNKPQGQAQVNNAAR